MCRCTSDGCMKHLEARLLRELVNREIHPIRCAESCRRKAQIAIRLGDLCAEAGYRWWAFKVWRLGMHLVASKDYDDWIAVYLNPERVRLSWVLSEDLCQLLGSKIDSLWRSMGHPEMAFHEQWVTAEYDWLYLEKFDYYRQEMDDYWYEVLEDYEEQKETETIFRDGLGLFYMVEEAMPKRARLSVNCKSWSFSRSFIILSTKVLGVVSPRSM